jgi:spore coat polysaccharide biosynthesis predicted glycosyltransferase SpsG
MIAFRCSAGAGVGQGHLMRCRALAGQLAQRGLDVAMIGPDASWQTTADAALFTHWIPLDAPEPVQDATNLADLAQRIGARALVLDDYRVDEPYQLVLREADFAWLQFETRYERALWADIVVNATLHADADSYLAIRNPRTRLLLGPRFACLRPQFAEMPKSVVSAPTKRVFLSLGGGDDRGLGAGIVQELIQQLPPEWTIDVASANGNSSLGRLQEMAASNGRRLQLVVDADDVAQMIFRSDLAIVGGGTLAYECAACATPMLILARAPDQLQARAWTDAGGARFVDAVGSCVPAEVAQAAVVLATAPDALARMRGALSGLVDGAGASRLALAAMALADESARA